MGRKKIVIKEISDAKARATTFQKRKVGLMKKAMEIAILCGADVALLVFNVRATAALPRRAAPARP